jgi:hypothetical protein
MFSKCWFYLLRTDRTVQIRTCCTTTNLRHGNRGKRARFLRQPLKNFFEGRSVVQEARYSSLLWHGFQGTIFSKSVQLYGP